MAQDPYSTVFTSVPALDEAARREMASLYLDAYDGTSEALFFHDLSKKDEALLVYSGRQLVGFTTLLVLEREWRSEPIRVVYSGDTVVDRAHWGQQALAFDWIGRIGDGTITRLIVERTKMRCHQAVAVDVIHGDQVGVFFVPFVDEPLMQRRTV